MEALGVCVASTPLLNGKRNERNDGDCRDRGNELRNLLLRGNHAIDACAKKREGECRRNDADECCYHEGRQLHANEGGHKVNQKKRYRYEPEKERVAEIGRGE